MMSLNKNECRKFSPNIFNKSKCQNCFACKDSHSAEALDNNRVSRKVSKCGYLFVAPDWDFTNPINRTKRWQRRWFVLFDDGELTYSVDEHPDTIPQALIDMTKVLEVSNAEELTGNQFAIAIIAPEKVHFVKGTSREESKWWYDVLSIFPRSIKNTRHKRNSTFPGGKASSVVDRPVEIQSSEPANNLDNKSDDVTTDGNIVNVKNRKNSHGLSHTPVQSKSLSLQSTNQTRERRLIKRGGPNPRSLSDGVNLMIPKEEKRKEINSNTDTYIVTVTDSNKNETGKIKTNSEISNKLTTNPSTSRLESIRSTQQDQHLSIPRLINAKEKSVSKNHTVFTHEADNFHLDHETNGQAQKELLNVRGDPDGCGLDTKSIVSASSHPIEHPVSIKKGWLLRHDGNDEWTKVWCVLNDNAIEYYDDSSDEVTGSSTAIVSLADICSIRKHHVVQQNGFQLEMQNGDTHTLSAITPSIRATWLNAVRSAVGFPCDDSTVEPLSSLGEKIEKESSSITDATTDIRPDSQHTSLDVPSSPRSGLSSDDEFKTASEASGRTEDYFEWADEDVDQSSTSRALPPSPPLNRTPISRVKERARTRSTVRGSQSDKNDGCKKSGSLSQSGCKEDASKDDLSGSDRETYSTPKMQRRSNNCRRRKNSSGTKSDIPESMMVELLESEVDSLKLQLTRCQQEILDLQQNNRLEVKSHEEETNPWQQKNVNKTREKENEIKANAIQDMQNWQKKYAELYSHYQNLRKKNELLEQTSGLNEREQHLFNACHRAEEKYRTEKIKWENESKVLDDECNRLVCNQQKTISQLEDRLRRSETKMMSLITEIEELEATIKKERTEKNGDLSSQDFEEGNCEMGLVELHRKLENTQKQVKSLKKELEIAEKSSDQYEMECINIRQSIGMNEEEHKSQMKLMVQRIEDLTTKLSTAEKQNRQIKQKFARLENKEQKRTRSLKGKELEMNKGEEIESKSASAEKITEKITEKKPTINEENGDTNSVQLLVRINALESNVEKATEKLLELKKGNKSEDDDELSSQDVCDSASLLSEVSRKKMADVDGESKSTIRRSLSAIQQIISFFKEKETTLAQLGLLNKQTQTKINIEKMIYQASLIGHTGGRLCRPSLNRYEVYKQKRRLYLNMTALEKKIESVESLDVLDEENISNDECDLKTLRSRVEKAMSSYKNINLNSLAVAMIRKATEKCVEKENEGIKVDVLAQKLTELEMKRVVSAVAHLREEEDAICSIIWDCDNSKMRDLIRTRLQKTTGAIVDELQHRFRQLLKTDVMKDSSDNSKSNLDTKLAEFVDIIAQETILVTRIDELNEFESDLIQCESDSESNQMIDDVFQREFELLHCEVDKFASSLVHTPRSKMSESFVDRSLNRKWNVQDVLKSVSDGKPSFFLNSVESRTARRSFRQRGQRSVTMPIFCSLETPETTTKKDCADCERLEEKLKEVKEKEGRNEEDIFKSIEAKTAQIKHLERQLRMAEQKVVAKEEENKQQIAALKEAYEEEAARKNDSSINEEAVRQTYQNEIDQLRGLCEKGLVAMENSHRRIVNELEEKHQRELDQLQAEKEQALAEETQATLAALDAMRKAHETELQREIVKFKQNFLEKMQSSHELDSLQKDQEEEIEAIKEEILSLSEKYSIKCLENASLEERLKPLLKQLTDANSLAFDLTARNKQLRAMLNLNNADLQSEIENSKDEDEIGSCKLKLKESELMERNEEIGDLKRMLRVSRRHEDELADRCHQLDQSLKAERRMRQDEVSSLRDRLEHIILTSNASLEAAVASSKTQVDPIISQPKMRRNIFGFKSRELMRSPSCPGLNINNDTVSAALECGGVVTSRKRLFEAGKSYC